MSNSSPEYNPQVLEDYDFFINKMKNKEPFAFAHFNDGEMQYILNKSQGPISRGAQDYDSKLAQHLKEAFLINNANFYRGIPCRKCFPEMRKESDELLQLHDTMNIPTTPACVFHHNYLRRKHELLQTIMSYDNITWVTNNTFNLDMVLYKMEQLKELDESKEAKESKDKKEKKRKSIRHIRIPGNNGYNKYEEMKTLDYNQGELVLYLCGPLGRILAGESSVKYPNTTFLCLGSYFDNLSNNVGHSYYFDDKLCEGCCPP